MPLYLKVVRFGDGFLDYDLSTKIGIEGGSIGRGQGANLVLPDENGYISRTHVQIEWDGEAFFITDCSSNGTLILEPIVGDVEDSFNEIFVHQAKRDLVDGCYIVIGEFEIEVQYCDNSNLVEKNNQVDLDQPDHHEYRKQTFQQPVFIETIDDNQKNDDYESELVKHDSVLQDHFSVPVPKPSQNSAPDIPEVFDINDFFGDTEQVLGNKQGEEDDDVFAGLQNPEMDDSGKDVKSEQDSFNEAENRVNEEVFDAIATSEESAVSDFIAPAEIERPLEEANKSVSDEVNVEPEPKDAVDMLGTLPKQDNANGLPANNVFFKGLGIDVSTLPKDQKSLDVLMLNAGKMLRTLLENNISLLKARTDLKREFSAQVTVIKKEENNPLKFCKSVDEALPYLFFENEPGFLSGQLAVEESAYDLCSHQMAMMAGIQPGLKEVINNFDPKVIKKICDVGHFNKGSKYWEFYENNYNNFAKEAQSIFFGSEFAEAYECQARAMKNAQ